MPYADAGKANEYQREYRRLQRAGDCTTPCTTPVPLAFRLQNAQDVIDLLQEQVEAVRADAEAGTLEKARTVGYLAGVALKAIEAGNVAGRWEAMGAVLRSRPVRPAHGEALSRHWGEATSAQAYNGRHE